MIGFAVAVVLLLLFFILFIDTIIENSIEYTGSHMVGAKVELDDAEFRFSPLGIQLTRLQVTNPDQPLQNILDIRKISFNMDGLNLLRRKVLINEMQVEGLSLNTARAKSGAIKQASKPVEQADSQKKQDQGLDLPDITIPNADEILAREEIKTVKQAETYQQDVKTSQDKWNKIRDGLPGDKRATEYKQRLDKIKQADTRDIKQLATAIRDLNSLKKDIQADINFIDTSRNQISADLKRLNSGLTELKGSPDKEYNRLLNKYSTSATGIGNISQLLFGSEAKKYTTMALGWYKKLEPWLAYVDFSGAEPTPQERHKGRDMRFREYHPVPDFLISKIKLSVETTRGNFTGQIIDITNEQNITGIPTTLRFTGNKMPAVDSILLTGKFDRIKAGNAKDQLNFTMRNYQLDKYRLIDQKDMVIFLDQAQSDIKLVAQRHNQKIQADFKSHIHSIKYNNKASGNELAMMFLSSINQTRDFNIYGNLRGTLDKYSTHVSSDLDKRLNANMKQHMNRRLAGFKKQLKDKIHLKTRQPIDEAEGKLKDLQSGVKNDIAMRKAQLTQKYNAAEQELKQKQQQQKAGAKQKLQKDLKGLLKKFK